MRPTGKMKIAIMAIVVVLSCGTVNAQPWRWHSRPHHVMTVITKPGVTVHASNRFTPKERFRMAMTYLKNHDYLTVKRYAKMTEQSKAAAKAELDAFAADKGKPIIAVTRGKKKVYTLRNGPR